MTTETLTPAPAPLAKSQVDLAVRAGVGAFFGLAAIVYGVGAYTRLSALATEGFTLSTFCRGLAILAICGFMATMTCLYIVRYPAVNKFAGWWACATALLGCFLSMGMMFLHQRTDLPIGLELTSSLMVLTGNGLTIYALFFLGKSFSILPEGRKLVTSGPYSLVRHPLYVVEGLATIGALINFWSPLAIALVATQFAFQFIRLRHEERVMTATFPEYADYAKRVARLIPGIY